MFLLTLVLVISFIFVKFFHKKLIPLLSLEAAMIYLICFFLCFKGSLDFFSLALYSLIFLVLMVLDSVLGICLLVVSSRSSSVFSLGL